MKDFFWGIISIFAILVIHLGIPAVITLIANIFLKRSIKSKKIKIIVNCLIFTILMICGIIAHGVYNKK